MDTKTEKLYKLIMNSHIDKFKSIFDNINQEYKSKFDDLKVEIINMLCSNETVSGLIKQNEDLEAKNKELTDELTRTEAVKQEVMESLDATRDLYDELTQKFDDLTVANKALEKEHNEFEMKFKLSISANDSLKTTNSGLLQQLDRAEAKQGELMEELVETQDLYEETLSAQKKVQQVCDAYETRYEEMKKQKDKLVSDYNLLNSSFAALKHKNACLERKVESMKKQEPSSSRFDVNKLVGKWIDDEDYDCIITLMPCCKNIFNVYDTGTEEQHTLKYDNNQLYLLSLGNQTKVTWFTDGAYQYLRCNFGTLKKRL